MNKPALYITLTFALLNIIAIFLDTHPYTKMFNAFSALVCLTSAVSQMYYYNK